MRTKYRAVPVVVDDTGTVFSRADLELLAQSRHVPTQALQRHRVGRSTLRPLTLSELASAVRVSGRAFASRAEATRYVFLVGESAAGRIEQLRCQVVYDLHAPGGIAVGKYVADFVYRRAGMTVVEDVKGVRTKAFIRSKKHLAAEYGIVVTEVHQR